VSQVWLKGLKAKEKRTQGLDRMEKKLEYITTRELENSAGKITGKIRVIMWKGENVAHVDYTCPECGFSEKTTVPWKKPFSVKCGNCGYLIRVPRLKTLIKKELKAVKNS